MFVSRSRISPAALFVNVIARISFGLTPTAEIRWATLWVSTRVFPEPAPAITSSGPSVCRTASRWAGFRLARYCSGDATDTLSMLAGAMVRPWRRAGSARRGSRSRRSGSAAWACPSSTGPTDEGEAIATIHRALELGVTFLDTRRHVRPVHERGARRPRDRRPRDEVVLATKFGNVRGDRRRVPRDQRRAPSTSASACDASLRRLGVEHDRPLLPAPRRPGDADRGDRRRDGRARRGGKVRYLGLSEAAPATIRACARRPSDLGAADRVLALDARSRGGGPADRARARDRLRRLQPARPRLPDRPDQVDRRPGRERLPPATGRASRRRTSQHNLALVAEVEALAAEKGVTAAQLALAWVLSRGDDIVPIPGTKRRSYLEENAAAVDLELTPADLERLERAFPAGAAAGDRYPDMSTVNR